MGYRAATHLATYTPQADGDFPNGNDVAPLTEFFELVHIADLIQQMIEVYWKEEMVSEETHVIGTSKTLQFFTNLNSTA